MRVGVTGATGFLGAHTCLRLQNRGHHTLALTRGAKVSGELDAVVHCAGVNRGTDREVHDGNVQAAQQLIDVLKESGNLSARVAYANSIHAGTTGAYGEGKAEALRTLQRAGLNVSDLRLPNLYGEGARPNYNSFVATFASAIARGKQPRVTDNRNIGLLYVGHAANALIMCVEGREAEVGPLLGRLDQVAIESVADLLAAQHASYLEGVMPDLDTSLQQRMFAILRRSMGRDGMVSRPTLHTDSRGDLFEGLRHRGEGQVFFSTTNPGCSRGNHYHMRKFERFMILSGEARLRCFDLLDRSTHEVSLAPGVVADMWTYDNHVLVNASEDRLHAAFWISEHFDPEDPDTYVLEST